MSDRLKTITHGYAWDALSPLLTTQERTFVIETAEKMDLTPVSAVLFLMNKGILEVKKEGGI